MPRTLARVWPTLVPVEGMLKECTGSVDQHTRVGVG
jgi:hypothetical protein